MKGVYKLEAARNILRGRLLDRSFQEKWGSVGPLERQERELSQEEHEPAPDNPSEEA